MYVPPPVPRCSGWVSSSLTSPSRVSLPRNCGRVGLHIVLFEACAAFTRVAARTLAPSPICDALHRRLQPFRHLLTAPVASGWSVRRVGLAPTGKPPSHGARRVEVWRGDVRLSMSVPAPFVWRCLSGSAVAPFPHPAHPTGQAISRIRLSDKTSRRLSRATPSAASEHHLELIGCPISMSFATFFVCLELRSLPSASVTRFPRTTNLSATPERPACPSRASGLSFISDLTTLWGFPCCARFPCVRAAATTRVQRLGVVLARLTQPYQPSPKLHRVGLHIVLFGDCSAFTRVAARTLAPSPISDQLHRRLQPFRHLHDCSGCFRLERSPGGSCTHWKAPPSHGARK